MHGSLPPLRFHGDRFRLPAMENAGHTHCGCSREARGGSRARGDTFRGVLLAPPGRGSHWGQACPGTPVLWEEPGSPQGSGRE